MTSYFCSGLFLLVFHPVFEAPFFSLAAWAVRNSSRNNDLDQASLNRTQKRRSEILEASLWLIPQLDGLYTTATGTTSWIREGLIHTYKNGSRDT